MKFPILTVFLASIIVSCSTSKDQIVLTKDTVSDYTILVSAEPDSLSLMAANELQDYIYNISEARLNIANKITDGNKFIAVGKSFIRDSATVSKLEALDEDGFMIETSDKNIFISGNDGKTNLYAAYTFIEEFLACRLLTPTEAYIPKNKTLIIPEIKAVYEPTFAFRRAHFPHKRSKKYMYWHKTEPLDEWGAFVHTFHKLVPPERYFESHPEYFSLLGNRRVQDAQLCLSNPEVIAVLKENLSVEIEKSPDKKYWSVSQNDCYNYCECNACKAMYDKYDGVSGAYIHMSNQLAKEFPDKQISTLAYQFTRSAPKNIKPLDNVNIMFCSIECNRSMPLAEDSRSSAFVTDMNNWSQLTNNIFLWDYVVQFKNYLTPFPNFHVLQPNIQFFSENNVNMMFQQGSGGSWSDLSDLKQYLISKLLWDKDADQEEIVNDFMQKYYGPAKPYIKTYYDLTHQELTKHQEKEFLNIYGFPMDYTDSYLTPKLLKQYKEIMDKAEASVKHDSIFLKRVQKARMPVDFAYLDVALNLNNDEISYLKKKGDSLLIRQDMLDYLDRFTKLSKHTGAEDINERNFITDDYRAYVQRKLELMTKTNLAKHASIKSLTSPSETYPVGGSKALTDGLFGDLDFHNNWLGYQGEDMILEIALHEVKTIKEVNMNFLKAVNSWVFLPVEISIEVSKDNVNFEKIGSIKGDITDQNYLVKSIPFNFQFSPIEVQYMRIKAESLKQCPKWHRGYGNPSWIFIDEVIIA